MQFLHTEFQTDHVYNFLNYGTLFSPNQTNFHLFDSCLYHLAAIILKTFQSTFESNPPLER